MPESSSRSFPTVPTALSALTAQSMTPDAPLPHPPSLGAGALLRWLLRRAAVPVTLATLAACTSNIIQAIVPAFVGAALDSGIENGLNARLWAICLSLLLLFGWMLAKGTGSKRAETGEAPGRTVISSGSSINTPQWVIDVGGISGNVTAPHNSVSVVMRVHPRVHEIHTHQVLRVRDGTIVGAIHIGRQVSLGDLLCCQRAVAGKLVSLRIGVPIRIKRLI